VTALAAYFNAGDLTLIELGSASNQLASTQAAL
jgi:hypothetical protein